MAGQQPCSGMTNASCAPTEPLTFRSRTAFTRCSTPRRRPVTGPNQGLGGWQAVSPERSVRTSGNLPALNACTNAPKKKGC